MPFPLFAPIIPPGYTGPTITSVVISDQAMGECGKSTYLTHRITVNLSGALSSSYDIRVYYCDSTSSGCTPTIEDTISGDGSSSYYVDVDHSADFYANILGSGGSGEGPETHHFNATAEIVDDGTTSPVWDTDDASEHDHDLYVCD